MAIYAIGDVQGCFDELLHLLDHIRYDPGTDTLWFTGDLVNRGPKSLEVLRFVRGLGTNAVTVLGNHDLHLLAVACGTHPPRKKDSFEPLLHAQDREELLHWLRRLPVLHWDKPLGWAMIHAGLPPQWDMTQAAACARELESVLRGDHFRDYCAHMYGDGPAVWDENLTGTKRLRFITNCLTRMRYCDRNGRLTLDAKGPPGTQSPRTLPWFAVPGRASEGQRIVCGHWSTLGFHVERDTYSLDSGCVWGGQLTALRIDGDTPERHSIDCPQGCRPGTP